MYYPLSVLLLIFPLSVLAIDESCLLSKYEKYVLVQQNWQKDLTELATSNNPELKEVADLYLNNQLILIEKSLIAVTLLLDQSPEKLKTDQKVNRWVQLDTFEENELAKKNIAYDRISKASKVNRNREPHIYGDNLRDVMRTQVMPSKSYKLLYSSFSGQIDVINSIKCSAI